MSQPVAAAKLAPPLATALRGAAEADLLEALRPALNAPSLDTAESGGPERIVTFVRPPVLFDPPIRVAREA